MPIFHKLTPRGLEKVKGILQYDEEILQEEREFEETDKEIDNSQGHQQTRITSLYIADRFNISTIASRGGIDRRSANNIMNCQTVKANTLQDFLTTFRARHLEVAHDKGIELNVYDYELIEGEDYILCSENTNPRTGKKTSSSIIPSPQEQLKIGLFDLNYKPQVRFFEDTINTLTTGSFLIHGDMNHGQKWLVNRLSYNIPYHDSAFREPIKLKRDHIKTGKLWQDLAKKLNTTYNNSLDNLAQSIYKQAQSSTVILCFHNIDILTNQDQQKLFNFCSVVTHDQQNVNYPIIIFLTSDISINTTNNEHFFDVPVLRIFEPVEVIHWVRTHGNLFTDEQIRDPTFKQMINDIIDHYNQNPITVFSRIAQYCNLDWTEIEETFSL